MRNRSRGQAVFETAIAMPLFLFVLFGAMWAVKEATMSERAQLGVRYGGVLGSLSNPYYNYSLYALYTAVQNDAVPSTLAATCETGITSIASGGRVQFFSPAGLPTPFCQSNQSRLAANTGTPGFTQDLLLQNDLAQYTAPVGTGGYLASNVFGTPSNSTLVSAFQNFFRSPDVGSLADCTQIGGELALTFSPSLDQSPLEAATPVPGVGGLDNAPLTVNSSANGTIGSCVGGATPPPGTVPTAAPPPVTGNTPAPSASPTFTPTPSPVPTPTKVPTATPSPTLKPTATPTPTPVPTASPKPTASPLPTPSPTPTAKPTASPVPTASPKPTATPTPTPVPTASPTPTAKPTASPVPTASPKPTNTPTPTPTPSPTPLPTASPVPTATASPTPSPAPTGSGGTYF